eukprot:6212096-Pleurochrysis_carterae.AAC.3
MLARANNGRTPVWRILGREVPGNRKRRTMRRGDDRRVLASCTALEEALIHRVPEKIVVFSPPRTNVGCLTCPPRSLAAGGGGNAVWTAKRSGEQEKDLP